MSNQTPALILLAPFVAAVVVSLLGLRRPAACFYVVVSALVAASAAAVATLLQVVAQGEILYFVGDWPRPLGIEYRVDSLNALILVVVAVAALLVAVYSRPVVARETPGKEPQFYTLFLLLVSGLVGMTLTGDAFNLYVLLEVSSLTSYALIALGRRRAALAAFRYLTMGTIGASLYLLGIGYLYIKTGSLNMIDIQQVLVQHGLLESKTVFVAFILIIVGVWIKMAFFPLHAWLPNAYTYAPTVTSCLLAPLVTKVSVYIMIRMLLTVFSPRFAFHQIHWDYLIVWLAVVAMIAGAVVALAQVNLKSLLCYVIVIEVAYMVGGVWIGSAIGLAGAFYHLIADAFMTLCLFLAAGVILARTQTTALAGFDGLFRRMPVTMAAFTLGALSVIGIPPTCGFFSKWYLLRAGMETGHWEYVAGLLISSLVLAILFFRIFEIAFFGAAPGSGNHAPPAAAKGELEAGSLWTVAPLVTAALLLVGIGLYNRELVDLIRQSLPLLAGSGGLG